jgi:hypothetical protein
MLKQRLCYIYDRDTFCVIIRATVKTFMKGTVKSSMENRGKNETTESFTVFDVELRRNEVFFVISLKI